MATSILLNSIRVGTQFFHAGTSIDDSQMDTTALLAAGGRLWPSTDALIASAAAKCVALRGQGQSGVVLDEIMGAAVDDSMRSTAAGQGASKLAIADALSIIVATDTEGALQELASARTRRVRAVITSQASLNAYTGSGTGVLTAGANGAFGAQDGVTLAANDLVFLPPIVTGATIAAKDTGPWIVTSLGTAGTKIVLTRPTWWAHAQVLGLAVDVMVGGEGTKWKGNVWRTFAAAGKVVDTDDPVFYPRYDHGTGAVGTQVTLVYAHTADAFSAQDVTAAAAVKAVFGSLGAGTATIDFTGTGVDSIKWSVFNF